LERVGKLLSLKDVLYFFYDNKRIRIEYRELLLALREVRLGNADAMKMLHLSWEVVDLLREYFPELVCLGIINLVFSFYPSCLEDYI
jgi:hypothetical protein